MTVLDSNRRLGSSRLNRELVRAIAVLAAVVIGASVAVVANADAPPAPNLVPEITPGTAAENGGATVPSSVAGLKIVFSAEIKGPAGQPEGNGIFEVNGDGSGFQTLLSSDSDSTVIYNWPEWALGGTKILFTKRTGPPVSSKDPKPQYENLWEMNPDGTDLRQLTDYQYRAVQPKMSPDGTSVMFAAENPQYPQIAIYELNLLTLQATNLSQVTQPLASVDSDPNVTPDGNIIMASTESSQGTNIDEIGAHGTNRQTIVDDGNFNTDPSVSPSGDEVAYSAYDGPNPALPGQTIDPLNPDDVALNPQGWYVTVRNLATGSTTVFDQGQACLSLSSNCRPGESSGWQPIWSPDGSTIAWTGHLNAATTCICASNAEGPNPIVLLESTNLIITWIDWTVPGDQAPPTAVSDSQIGSQQPNSQLLVSTQPTGGGNPELLEESPDMMSVQVLSAGGASDPQMARFGPQTSEYVYVANASYNPNDPHYGPPPPPGQQVHGHFTLQQMNPGFPTYPPTDVSPDEQIFLHKSDGTVVQLTTPGTEDWKDAIDPGDDRSNTDPVQSPDDGHVVFTNHSTLTGESFLLSMDLRTGSVLNLTNGTAGAVEVNDSLPVFSPDGSKIAFTWTDVATTDVYVMDAATGKVVTQITDDNAFDSDPTWSPDGKYIVYSHFDGILQPTPAQEDSLTGLPYFGWALVKVNVQTGAEQVLTSPSDSPTFRPVFSPDGSKIDFIGDKYGFLGLFQTTPDGAPVLPLLVTPRVNVTMVDWRTR